MSLFIPTYFSSILQYSKMLSSDKLIFEMEDNFQKQTYRNRCYIYSANGKQSLNIPVRHNHGSDRKKTKDTLVADDFDWQTQHFKSLKVAYQSSPFFEFFEDDLAVIFNKRYKYLHDVNIDTFLFVTDALQVSQEFIKTTEYELSPNVNDYRYLAIAKKEEVPPMDIYTQMFDDKHGFIPNLSILDLLFMEGSNAISFLEK